MMLSVDAGATVGVAVAKTTENGGFTPEQVAEMALEKIIHVSDGTVAPLRDQAHAFRQYIRDTLLFYMKFAINQDRATICFELRKAGHEDLAKYVKDM